MAASNPRQRQQAMIDHINRVYGKQPDVEAKRRTAKMKLKFRSVIKDRW
jgi:hypothetical protein